ncbi:MAG TPA: hypothetical protein VEC93_08920 [Anaerolineae bacterium]|nr:hypothetical protein [Anaerolineae bacterium]
MYDNTINAFRTGSQFMDQAMQQRRLEQDQKNQQADIDQNKGAYNAYASAKGEMGQEKQGESIRHLRTFGPTGNALADRLEAADTADKIAAEKAGIEKLGSISYSVMNSENPEAAHAKFYASASPEEKKRMGPKFDPDQYRVNLAVAGLADKELAVKEKSLKVEGAAAENTGKALQNEGRKLANEGAKLENKKIQKDLDITSAEKIAEKAEKASQKEHEKLIEYVKLLTEKQSDGMTELTPQESAFLTKYGRLVSGRVDRLLEKEIPGSPVDFSNRTTAGGVGWSLAE